MYMDMDSNSNRNTNIENVNMNTYEYMKRRPAFNSDIVTGSDVGMRIRIQLLYIF